MVMVSTTICTATPSGSPMFNTLQEDYYGEEDDNDQTQEEEDGITSSDSGNSRRGLYSSLSELPSSQEQQHQVRRRNYIIDRLHRLWSNLTFLEVSGSCGDFGTLLPLLVAMARQRSIYIAPTLFCTGIVHIITGWIWDIPMPLQPMKSIAAVAIAENMTRTQVTAAGIWMGIIMLFLSQCGGIELIHRIVPNSIVSGLQVGVGLRLAIHGIYSIQELSTYWWDDSGSNHENIDSKFLAILSSLLCLYWLREEDPQQQQQQQQQQEVVSASAETSTTTELPQDQQQQQQYTRIHQESHDNHCDRSGQQQQQQQQYTTSSSSLASLCQKLAKKPPVGLYLFGLGMIIGGYQLATSTDDDSVMDEDDFIPNADNNNNNNNYNDESILTNALKDITLEDWKIGLLLGAIPQLPLTILNSVLSVCLLAHNFFPEKRLNKHQQQQQRQSDEVHQSSSIDNNDDDSHYENTMANNTTEDDTHISNVVDIDESPTTITADTSSCNTANNSLNSNTFITTTTNSLYRSSDAVVENNNDNNTDDETTVVSRREVCLSIGLMNIILCPLGCMPNCHGAGGLAGQYRLGATSGTSMVLLGICKVLVAIVVGGERLIYILDTLPVSILGVLLVFAGHELATTGITSLLQQQTTAISSSSFSLLLRQAAVITMVTAMVIVGTGKTHYGAFWGWITYMIYGSGIKDLKSWFCSSRFGYNQQQYVHG